MAAQKYTEARRDSNRRWDAANLDRISVALPKGMKATIQDAASKHGLSLNAFIAAAITEKLERDAGEK